jgi:hypothetical protein
LEKEMERTFCERAALSDPEASEAEIEMLARDLEEWVENHAAVVAKLGATRQIRATIHVAEWSEGFGFECTFTNGRGAKYSMELVATGTNLLGSSVNSSVRDTVAAMQVIAALLGRLGMTASIN